MRAWPVDPNERGIVVQIAKQLPENRQDKE